MLCDVNQGCADLARRIGEVFLKNSVTIRVAPAKLGPSTHEPGLFHPKMIIIDDAVAVVGSANLTGKALGIGLKPHNVEMSIGLTGAKSRATIAQLVQYFDQWWEKASLLSSANKHDKEESDTMAQPEYVMFGNYKECVTDKGLVPGM